MFAFIESFLPKIFGKTLFINKSWWIWPMMPKNDYFYLQYSGSPILYSSVDIENTDVENQSNLHVT